MKQEVIAVFGVLLTEIVKDLFGNSD